MGKGTERESGMGGMRHGRSRARLALLHVMARLALMALVLALVAVAGCGGDTASKSSSGQQRASASPTGATGTTAPGTTGAAGTSGATGAAGKSGAARKTGSRAKRAGSPQRSGTQNSAAPRAPKPAAPPAAPNSGKKQTKPYRLTEEQLKQAAPGYYQQAYQFCKAYTLERLAKDYNITSGDPGEVAKAYASGWALGLRKAVAAGCKKGLIESK